MTGQLPIVGIAPPLKAAFVPSALGTLAIKARSGASLPSGKLVLIATSKSQTAHWLQDGQVQDGVFTVPMEGFEAVAASAPETDWTLTLGQITEKGLITRRLQYKALGLKDKLPGMSEEEMLQLLATDGMLVKRPLLVGSDFVLVGFKEAQWAEQLGKL